MRNKDKALERILKMLVCISMVFSPLTLYAQKYAVVNTDYVMKNIPEYANAQKRLDRYVEDWTRELAERQSELDAMRAAYEQESYLLPENLKKRRQEEIRAKEQEILALQQQRFGAGGDLDKRRAELLKPVQDRVYATIERIAHEKNFAFVFDKAGSATVLYASKKYDISDEVLELMGYKPGAAAEQQPAGATGGEQQRKPVNPEMRHPDASRSRMPLDNAK